MLSGEPFASAVFPFAPPVSRTVWGWLLMKPATSTKLALFCCYFYSTAGAVMQVFFYKTVTFWGCVDEVTEFRCCFWLFCTTEMGRGRAKRQEALNNYFFPALSFFKHVHLCSKKANNKSPHSQRLQLLLPGFYPCSISKLYLTLG